MCITLETKYYIAKHEKAVSEKKKMGSQNKRIETANLKIKDLGEPQRKEKSIFYPSFRKFNNFQIEIKSRILKAQFKIEQPESQQVSISQQIFTDLEEAFLYKTKDILFHTVIHDFDYHNMKIYNGSNDGKPITIHFKAFNLFNSFAFISSLYQVNIHHLISKLQSPFLNTLTESYIIQTGLQAQGQENPNSYIFVLSPVETSLSEIIKYRKQNNWPWTTNQFVSLTSDLLNAVKQLHRKNISHNDIRPSNIFYSSSKNCYQLTNFSSAVITQQKHKKLGSKYSNLEMSAVRGSIHYSDPEMGNKKFIDLLKSDIYSLGLTLLSAFYLLQPIKLQLIQKLNQSFKKEHPILQTLVQMVQQSDRRPNIEQILNRIPKPDKQSQMKNLIESLKYRHIPKGADQIEAKRILSQGYQRLGLWNQWKQLVAEAYSLEEKTLDSYKKAETLFQLARIQKCRGDLISAQQYAKSALILYKQIGYSAYEQGNINQSLKLYQKAVQCSKYFTNYWDIDSARILQHLAIIHAQKGQYGISRPLISEVCYMVQKNIGQQSIEYCQVKISEAKIQSDFGLFQSADKILMQTLAIANTKISTNEKEAQRLKAKILHQIGRNLMLNSSYQSDISKSLIPKAQRYINESILICQRDPQYNSELAANFNIVGQIELRKQNYTSAKLSFKKAYELTQLKMRTQNASLPEKQKADSLCNLAICQNGLNNQKQALDYYTSALEMYRKVYGTDHNKFSAIAIGNMSKVYSKLGEQEKALDCLKIASQILQDLLGEQDPDYKHFKSLQQNFWR